MMHTLLLTALLVAQFASTPTQVTSQRQTAPSFALKDIRGRTVRLSDYKGKVVLLNFWATWCVPCQAEMPELIKLQKEYRARGLQIIGVTFPPERASAVRRVARKFKLNYSVLYGTSEMAKAYDVGEVLPTTVVVDRDGNMRSRILGILDAQDFRERVALLLD